MFLFSASKYSYLILIFYETCLPVEVLRLAFTLIILSN